MLSKAPSYIYRTLVESRKLSPSWTDALLDLLGPTQTHRVQQISNMYFQSLTATRIVLLTPSHCGTARADLFYSYGCVLGPSSSFLIPVTLLNRFSSVLDSLQHYHSISFLRFFYTRHVYTYKSKLYTHIPLATLPIRSFDDPDIDLPINVYSVDHSHPEFSNQ